jgi:preprotein translocase subunit SecD
MTYAIRDLTEVIHIKRLPLIADENVAEVTRTQDPRDVQVKLSADGTKKFAHKISSMAEGRFAILIQGKIISAPIIKKSPLGGNFEITLENADEAEVFVRTFKKSRG